MYYHYLTTLAPPPRHYVYKQAVAYPLSFATEIYSKSELEMTEVIVAGSLIPVP